MPTMNRYNYNLPNTRERIAARRKARRRDGSHVRPGPRRVAGSWLASGRLLSLLVLIAALGGLGYAFTSPQFMVQQVHVEGVQVMRPESVAALSEAPGQSIWFVDLERIVERLEANAYVERATVSVALPDQVLITVVERRPEVRWQVGGVRYLVDADGRVLGTDPTVTLTNTLVVDDRSGRPLQPNDYVDADALALSRTLALRLPRELQLQPVSIGWDVGTGVFVLTGDQRTIVFGESSNLEEKLAVLKTLLRDGTSFTFLDLRPATPYYRTGGDGLLPPAQNAPLPGN